MWRANKKGDHWGSGEKEDGNELSLEVFAFAVRVTVGNHSTHMGAADIYVDKLFILPLTLS